MSIAPMSIAPMSIAPMSIAPMSIAPMSIAHRDIVPIIQSDICIVGHCFQEHCSGEQCTDGMSLKKEQSRYLESGLVFKKTKCQFEIRMARLGDFSTFEGFYFCLCFPYVFLPEKAINYVNLTLWARLHFGPLWAIFHTIIWSPCLKRPIFQAFKTAFFKLI
jgi:hypothetical protein